MADRVVLSLGQADASNQTLHWGLRECSPYSDRHRPYRLPDLAHGPTRSKSGAQPSRICPARPHQPHAQTSDQPVARTPTADPDKLKSVETWAILPMNRTAVDLIRASIHLRNKLFRRKMDHRVVPGDGDRDWYGGHARRDLSAVAQQAKAEATKQSLFLLRGEIDCFAETLHG